MSLGNLPSHPDFPKLVDKIEKILDNHREAVVREAVRGPEYKVRVTGGKCDVLQEVLSMLNEAKRRNEE